LGTSGFGSDDTKLNLCGVTVGHAFPILGYYEASFNGTTHKLYLVRDPRGNEAKTSYNLTYNSTDFETWNPELIAQLPINPLTMSNGIFYVGADDLARCFSTLDQVVYKNGQGYRNYWYDVDDDPI
jgi:hypothetical protein